MDAARPGVASLRQQVTHPTPPGSTRQRSRIAWLAAVVIATAFLASFFLTLSDYGMTWDEAENFYAGERNLRVLTTLDRSWVTFPEERFRDGSATENYRTYTQAVERFIDASADDLQEGSGEGFAQNDLPYLWPYPPVANMVAAATRSVLSDWLGFLDPVPGYHASIGLIWAVMLVAAYRFAWRNWGHVAAIVASMLLCVVPRLWGPIHNNVKDPPLAALFALTLIALHKGVTEQRPRWIAASGVLTGLTVGTKLNGAFVLVIGAVWVISVVPQYVRGNRKLLGALLASPVIAVATFVLTWPYLWIEPGRRLLLVVGYARDLLAVTPGVRPGYSAYYAAITTPISVILLAAIGGLWLLLSFRSSPDRPLLLLGLWFMVPIARAGLPGAGFYDGIRQYMEFWPALAVIAGIGAARLVVWVGARVSHSVGANGTRWLVGGVVVCAALAPSVYADVRAHPYQDTFFNRLVGGLPGAQARGIPWATDYWGASYLDTVRWANAKLDRGAVVVAPIAGHLLRLNGLRADIAVRAEPPPRGTAQGSFYIVYITRNEFYPAWLRRYDRRAPFRTVEAFDVPIQKIHRVARSE